VELLHEAPELLPAVLEARELVERGAGRGEQDDVAGSGGAVGGGHRGGEVAGALVRDAPGIERRSDRGSGSADQVRMVACLERRGKRRIRLALPESAST
jgi:uncharacterized protein YcfJ